MKLKNGCPISGQSDINKFINDEDDVTETKQRNNMIINIILLIVLVVIFDIVYEKWENK